jgi:hypothetical protein
MWVVICHKSITPFKVFYACTSGPYYRYLNDKVCFLGSNEVAHPFPNGLEETNMPLFG